MKVLMQSRADLYTKPGGDLIQMEKTRAALEKKGVETVISTEIEPDLSNYDIVHLFNITRIHETLLQAQNAKKQQKPLVLSPIYHIQKEIDRYEKYGRSGPLKLLTNFGLNTESKEKMKLIYRSLKSKKQLKPSLAVLKKGFYNSQKYTLELADILCVLANKEYQQIEEDFAIKKPYIVTPNAVDLKKIAAKSSLPSEINDLPPFILCVGRIEDRKNQIALIKAVRELSVPVVFVGKPNPLHKEYVKEFLSLVKNNRNIHYIESLPYEQVLTLYTMAAVSVSVSWFEVLSLTILEAATMGSTIVTTNVGFIEEYIKDKAFYCKPDDINSITSALKKALHTAKNNQLSLELKKLSWEKTADKVMEAYRNVLSK